MNDNHSILERNTLAGFSEAAGMLYLRLLDQYQGDEQRAFMAANQFEDQCAATLGNIIERYPGFLDITTGTKSKLSRFFAERWRHNFMPRTALDDLPPI
jgi:hypothetical protein